MEIITLQYSILYNNGHEDTILQEVTEDNKATLQEINGIIIDSMREGFDATITLENKEDSGRYLIRLTDVSRVKISDYHEQQPV